MQAVGVDGCANGWVEVVLDDRGFSRAVWGPDIETLAHQVPDADGFGIDIPIGLFGDRFRLADLAARREIGLRRSSVFLTPPRAALEAATHAEASRISRHLAQAGLSVQAYALRHKILEVDRWWPGAPCPVWEVHPEVSFATLAGRPLTAGKKSWNGLGARAELLRRARIVLPANLGGAGTATPDDVVDAAVVAWSCRRLLAGQGRSWPDPPEVGPEGRPVAIWA